MGDQQQLPVKKDVARALLLKGTVFVHLDPRDDAVEVPSWLKDQPQLVLQVGTEMPIPIPDLRIDDDGLYGTLSFNRDPFTCTVPWDRVFAVVGDDGRGMVWPESMPPEIAAEVDREARRGRAAELEAACGKGDRHKDDTRDVPLESDAEGIRDSKVPIPLHTDANLPDGSFRVRSRPSVVPAAPVIRAITAQEVEAGRTRPPGKPSQRPRGRVKLPPYMRVVK